MRKRFWCLACMIAVTLGFAVHAGAAQAPVVRVKLASTLTTAMIKPVQGEYQMVNGTTGLPLGIVKPGQICYVGKQGLTLKVSGLNPAVTAPQQGPIVLKPSGDQKGCIISLNNASYRGNLTVYNMEQGLMAVNTLPVEEYLYGVVGEEMGYGAPLEALKAQALISRSYALNKRGTDLYADVSPDVSSQLYKGYVSERKTGFTKVKQAVDATAGEVICYQGNIIDAVFHSNAGGYTECCENVWKEPHPYLRAVASPADSYAQRHPQDAKGWPANTYEWSVTLTRTQLEECVSDWNAARPADGINIGDIQDIVISRTDRSGTRDTASGRATALTLVGTSGKKTITRDNIRSFFRVGGKPLPSTLITNITFSPGAAALGAGGATGQVSGSSIKSVDASNKVTAPEPGTPKIYIVGKDDRTNTIPKQFTSITIKGRGYGHGLGLSQWGAMGMAVEQNASYQEIIKHYYTGVEIKKLY